MTDDGRYFKTAAEANDWLAFDSDLEDTAAEQAANTQPDHYAEWRLWRVAAERLDPWPLDRIRRHDQRKQLRYELVCSIGSVPGAEYATSGRGFTDDLDLAIWHSDRSEYPGWDVYDHLEKAHAGGGPPEQYLIRHAIQRFIAELTVPGFHEYAYIELDEIGKKRRAEESAKHLAKYPNWRPVAEPIMAPLRVALYVAMASERAYAEEQPPAGKLAIYPDGRDLEPGYYRKLVYDSVITGVVDRVVTKDEHAVSYAKRMIELIGVPEDSTIERELQHCTLDGEPLIAVAVDLPKGWEVS